MSVDAQLRHRGWSHLRVVRVLLHLGVVDDLVLLGIGLDLFVDLVVLLHVELLLFFDLRLLLRIFEQACLEVRSYHVSIEHFLNFTSGLWPEEPSAIDTQEVHLRLLLEEGRCAEYI